METVKCDYCNRKFNDITLLSLHQEYEACGNSNPSAEAIFICPICDDIFDDPRVLQIHVNEAHDQKSASPKPATTSDSLYAQDLDRRERMKHQYEQQRQTSVELVYEEPFESADAQLARLLQEEENAQSFEEFQNRYGGSRTTFTERARVNLERVFKRKAISEQKYNEYKNQLEQMIAQPTERAESRSTGLIPLLQNLPMGNFRDRRLCRPGCDHFSSTWLDQGWACGYKNFQMLLSSLRDDPLYSTHLFGTTNREIPSVSYLQNLIEKAWSAGFDSEGREQLNGRLINSTKWIGPTEVMACLASLNIKTELLDFHQPKNVEKTSAYKYLFEWVRTYFQEQQENRNQNIHPLYLQHEGHSRTIVGYEQYRNGNLRFLIFDPSTSKTEIEKFQNNPNQKAHLFRRDLHAFQKPVYQVLVVRGLLKPDERERAKRLRSIKMPIPNS